MPRRKGKNSNIAHYNKGTTHPNAGNGHQSRGVGRWPKTRATRDQVGGSPKRAREDDKAPYGEKENQDSISPAKRRKITGVLTSTPAALVMPQA
ncbi:hypothetical protein GGF50DRAFT_117101 [Schizophyllum commune]